MLLVKSNTLVLMQKIFPLLVLWKSKYLAVAGDIPAARLGN